jgi:hypothetical protein
MTEEYIKQLEERIKQLEKELGPKVTEQECIAWLQSQGITDQRKLTQLKSSRPKWIPSNPHIFYKYSSAKEFWNLVVPKTPKTPKTPQIGCIDCGKPTRANGYCQQCYQRKWRIAHPDYHKIWVYQNKGSKQ